MRILLTFIRIYPFQSAIMVAALLAAGVLEGIGLSLFLPLLTLASGQNGGAEGAAVIPSQLEQMVAAAFQRMGITPSIGILLTAIVIAITFKSVMMLLAKRQVGYTVARVATDLRLELLRALMTTRWEYFVQQPVGSLANSMASEAYRAARAYLHAVLMISEFLLAVVYAVTACLVSWKVALLALAAGCLVVFVLKRFVSRSRKAGYRQTTLLKSLLALMTDTLQSIKPLKAMAREEVADYLLEKKTRRLNKALQKQVLNKEMLKAFREPLSVVILAVGIYVVLVYLRMPIAVVMVLVFLLARLINQLAKIQERYQEVAVFESAYWSLKQTIDEINSAAETGTGKLEPSMTRSIRLESVDFSYDSKPVLKNVSLDFKAGEISAIIGPSGSGKTTVVDMISGLLRPRKGEVLIDDVKLCDIDLGQWRRKIGYIPQETLLLHDSVFNNVGLGDRGISETEVVQALRKAGAWDFVSRMPEGIHSIVGERGGKLSGGQRQRIAIARALVHQPMLLILDEATSALDPENEAAICATLKELKEQHTIVAISHQPAILDVADKAYRIEDGRVLPV
jgi:ATP-binding cassette subfamily C protein